MTLFAQPGHGAQGDGGEHGAGGEVLRPAGQPCPWWALRRQDRTDDGREDGEDEQAYRPELAGAHRGRSRTALVVITRLP